MEYHIFQTFNSFFCKNDQQDSGENLLMNFFLTEPDVLSNSDQQRVQLQRPNLLQNVSYPGQFLQTSAEWITASHCQESGSNISNSCAACRAKRSRPKSHKTKILMAAKMGAGIGWTDGIWHYRLMNAGSSAGTFKVTLRLSLTRLNVSKKLLIEMFEASMCELRAGMESEGDQEAAGQTHCSFYLELNDGKANKIHHLQKV